MTSILIKLARDRFTAAWALLVVATLASWYFGTDHGIHSTLWKGPPRRPSPASATASV
jgi:hypothetical protein